MKVSSIKGMHDIGPPKIDLWHQVEKTAREIFENAGFKELRTPVIEEEILFTQSIGKQTDIVDKEMYAFADKKGKVLALRPEGTASIVRAFIEHYSGQGGHTQRFYYTGPMFRYERPQKGRYRQFYQMGAEIFGSSHPLTDVEVISLAHTLFQKLQLKEVLLQLNSLGCKECRPAFRKTLIEFLKPLENELCEDCKQRLQHNPLRTLDCKKENCRNLTQGAPSAIDHLCEKCSGHFNQVQIGLRTLNIPYEVNPRMVRGLDYYESTAFEFLSAELGAQNAVGGGGRYDNLVESLGGTSTAAIGFAIGLERLVELVSKTGISQAKKPILFFAPLGEMAQIQMLPLILRLRQEGFEVQADFDSKSLKSMLRQADRLQADWVVIVGENEIQKGIVQIKNMKKQEPQKEIPLQGLNLFFSEIKKES